MLRCSQKLKWGKGCSITEIVRDDEDHLVISGRQRWGGVYQKWEDCSTPLTGYDKG